MINTRRPKKCNRREFTEVVSKEIVNYWGDHPCNSTPLISIRA